MKKIKKNIFAISAAATAIPVNPNKAATIDMIKKTTVTKMRFLA